MQASLLDRGCSMTRRWLAFSVVWLVLGVLPASASMLCLFAESGTPATAATNCVKTQQNGTTGGYQTINCAAASSGVISLPCIIPAGAGNSYTFRVWGYQGDAGSSKTCQYGLSIISKVGACVGGSNDNNPCLLDSQCPSGACSDRYVDNLAPVEFILNTEASASITTSSAGSTTLYFTPISGSGTINYVHDGGTATCPAGTACSNAPAKCLLNAYMVGSSNAASCNFQSLCIYY